MYARLSHFRWPAANTAEGIRVARERLLPAFRQAPGFRGLDVLVDRGTGEGVGISWWATAADAAAAGGPEAAPQAALCRRIERPLGELFVFVEDPAVPPTNNAAERSLRHLVTCRKISGGTRSEAGTDTKMTLASLFGTWRALGLNPLEQCRALLAAPQG